MALALAASLATVLLPPASVGAAPAGYPVTGVDVSHLPFLVLDADRFVLESHLARANTQWRGIANGSQVKAVFHGPNAYISPSWYQARPYVPTWNYLSLHVTGSIEFIHEPADIIENLHRTIAFYEAAYGDQWDPGPSAEYIERIVRGVVAFKLNVETWDMAAKLSQDKDAEIQHRVVAALKGTGRTQDLAVAELIEIENHHATTRSPS